MAASYTWPGGLPASPLTDYTEEKNLNVLITPMDAGPAKMRRRSLMPDTLRVSYVLTAAQVSTLETFVFTTLSGIARFNYTHPRTGVSEEVRIVPQGEAMYTISYESKDLYRVNLTLQVLP
jgi:hypothetical protein